MFYRSYTLCFVKLSVHLFFPHSAPRKDDTVTCIIRSKLLSPHASVTPIELRGTTPLLTNPWSFRTHFAPIAAINDWKQNIMHFIHGTCVLLSNKVDRLSTAVAPQLVNDDIESQRRPYLWSLICFANNSRLWCHVFCFIQVLRPPPVQTLWSPVMARVPSATMNYDATSAHDFVVQFLESTREDSSFVTGLLNATFLGALARLTGGYLLIGICSYQSCGRKLYKSW